MFSNTLGTGLLTEVLQSRDVLFHLASFTDDPLVFSTYYRIRWDTMWQAFTNGAFGFARCQANSETNKNCLLRVDAKKEAHEFTSLFNGSFVRKCDYASFAESYARDIAAGFHLAYVEKPQNRDYRPLVVDVDKVPPEIYKDGQIIAEIAGVFVGVLRERMDGIVPEDLAFLEQTKGAEFFNAHLIWKGFALKEDTAKYITRLATEEMQRRYPEHDWKSIIDACVAGPNGLRMIGSFKSYAFEHLRRDYPNIWRVHYRPDKNGNPTTNRNYNTKKAYLLPDLDKGVYMPKGHTGPITAEIVQQHSIILPPGVKVLAVKAEYADELAATTKKKAAPSRAQNKKTKREDKNQDAAIAAKVATVTAYLTSIGGHEGLYHSPSERPHTTGSECTTLFFRTPGSRTCFCHPDRVHDSNGIYVRWGRERVMYHCLSSHCKEEPKEMVNIHALHMQRLQTQQEALGAHMTAKVPPGWDSETTDEMHVKDIAEYLRRHKIVCYKAMMGSGKSTAVRAMIAELGSETILLATPRRAYADSLQAELKKHGIIAVHYNDIVGDITADIVIVQMESLHRILHDKFYALVIIDESESCFKAISSETMKNSVGCINTLERVIKGAKYVVALDAFLSTRTTMGLHLMDKAAPGKVCTYTHQHIKRKGVHIATIKQLKELAIRKVGQVGPDGQHKRIFFFCSIKKDADVFEEQLISLGIKYIYYHSNMSKETSATLLDVATAWSDVQVVLATPTVTVGINYDIVGKFDSVFVFVSNQSCCPRDIMQATCRVRDYVDGTVYVAFSESCRRQETAITCALVEASVEAHIQNAENAVEERHYWHESESVRQIVAVNRVEDTMKVYQMIPQTLALFAMSGVHFSEVDGILPDDHDHDHHHDHLTPDDKQDKAVPILFNELALITSQEDYRIRTSVRMRGDVTEEQIQETEKYAFHHFQRFRIDNRSNAIDALVYDHIWVFLKLRRKMYNIYFQGLAEKRYERIDLADYCTNGVPCKADMRAAQLRTIDTINRLLMGVEAGPTDHRACLLSEDTHIDQARLERTVDYVRDNKETIFTLFGLRSVANHKEADTFGGKLKTLNAVLQAWGYSKIGSKRRNVKKITHYVYYVESGVPGVLLSDIYSKVRDNAFGRVAETVKRQRV